MRKFVVVAALAMPLVTAFPAASFAEEAPIIVACRAYAAAVADDYMADEMLRVDAADDQRKGFITAHVYGRKYLIPVRSPGGSNIKPQAIGARTIEWGKIYGEERRRCLRSRTLGDFTALN